MRIGIDAHAIGTAAGGNETYIRSLLQALSKHATHEDYIALMQSSAVHQAPAAMKRHPFRLHASALRTPLELPWACLRLRLDLLHVQYNAPPICPSPFVVSVHDVGWERHPELFTNRMRRRLAALVPGTLRRAARVFALTHAIKQEIHDTYGTPLEKIDVVSPGVDESYFEKVSPEIIATARGRYQVPEHYILYVGALQPRKNLVRLARAYKRLIETHPDLPHRLVIAGRKTWLYGDIIKGIEALALGGRLLFTGYVDQADLIPLIQGAAAFTYISIYEGFGLPVLEAMAGGVPVITSDVPALREVAAHAAVFCDPMDEDSILVSLENILLDGLAQTRLREEGPARAGHYTLGSMADSAAAGYRAALG